MERAPQSKSISHQLHDQESTYIHGSEGDLGKLRMRTYEQTPTAWQSAERATWLTHCADQAPGINGVEHHLRAEETSLDFPRFFVVKLLQCRQSLKQTANKRSTEQQEEMKENGKERASA